MSMDNLDAKVTKASILLKLQHDEDVLRTTLSYVSTDTSKSWIKSRLDYIKSLKAYIRKM